VEHLVGSWESFHDFMMAHRDHELSQSEGAPKDRAADVSSAEPSFFCRQDAGSTLRFMGSFNLHWFRWILFSSDYMMPS